MRVIMTREQVLAIADKRPFFVQKYGLAHEKLRKLTRRMLREDLLVMTSSNSRGFNYVSAGKAADDADEKAFCLSDDALCPEDM